MASRRAPKEQPIAFRPRPGTRARLAKRAGTRSLSAVVEQAVDAWLGRVVREVDPTLRAALAVELGIIGDRLSDIAHQSAGIGRNCNQLARYCNTYRELPVGISDELAELRAAVNALAAELAAVRQTLDAILGGK
ncbi:plasmid mobilization relaxosome protein MobC [Gordonia sp. 852002-51296_SCH5728562-b]|uniref:plasmid mobilization relaxosome protein MobC n=1 Tax=Gordonia sp. 852002-51296_SCH5728562-b TaxID=1834101 RepID=UPI0007EAAC20|nr:plasmid mobilization relaxosome protein MobC [Gordonia sp. 852002-51296_SCH5728562-b]OBA40773.1 hypothetical protein A5766_01915 [Gordonia sp. 852002-51296_SCH5728562-b]